MTIVRCLGALALLCSAVSPLPGQALTEVCRPLQQPAVGGWARYRLQTGTGDTTEFRLAVVGREAWGGTPHLWLESVIHAPSGQTVIHSLVPADPYDPTAIHRAVIHLPGREPMDLPASALAVFAQSSGQGGAGIDACRTGEPLGWETLAVPAGPVRALHVRYARDGRTADTWLAPGIPFALVRSSSGDPSDPKRFELVLVAHGRDASPTAPLPEASR